MLNAFFRWLREGAKNAILDGVADGVEIVTEDHKSPSPRLAALAAKLTPAPALPAAKDDDEPAKGKGKKQAA